VKWKKNGFPLLPFFSPPLFFFFLFRPAPRGVLERKEKRMDKKEARDVRTEPSSIGQLLLSLFLFPFLSISFDLFPADDGSADVLGGESVQRGIPSFFSPLFPPLFFSFFPFLPFQRLRVETWSQKGLMGRVADKVFFFLPSFFLSLPPFFLLFFFFLPFPVPAGGRIKG